MANDDDDKNLLLFCSLYQRPDALCLGSIQKRRERGRVCFIVRHFFLFSFITLWSFKKGFRVLIKGFVLRWDLVELYIYIYIY